MIYLDESSLAFLGKAYENNANLDKVYLQKLFRAVDTGLSYRQIQELEKVDLLKTERTSNKEWRRYSLIEVALILIVKELKKYGFEFSQLEIVMDFLGATEIELEWINKKMPVIKAIITFGFSGMPLYFLTTDDNVLGIFDTPNYDTFAKSKYAGSSYITINVANVVQGVLKDIDKRLGHENDLDIYFDPSSELSDTEKTIIRAVRNGEYNSLEVVMKDGIVRQLNTKKTTPSRVGGLTKNEIIELIKTKDFGSITMQVEAGKVVSLTGIDKIKIRI